MAMISIENIVHFRILYLVAVWLVFWLATVQPGNSAMKASD